MSIAIIVHEQRDVTRFSNKQNVNCKDVIVMYKHNASQPLAVKCSSAKIILRSYEIGVYALSVTRNIKDGRSIIASFLAVALLESVLL